MKLKKHAKFYWIILSRVLIGVLVGTVPILLIGESIIEVLGAGFLGIVVANAVGAAVGSFAAGWTLWVLGPREMLEGANKGGWAVALRAAGFGLVYGVGVGIYVLISGSSMGAGAYDVGRLGSIAVVGPMVLCWRFDLIASKKEEKKNSQSS